MEFKLGQKYRIVDIDAWWSSKIFDENGAFADGEFENGDIVVVNYDYTNRLSFFLIDSLLNSHAIESLIENNGWHDSCIELITDDDSESDDTISLYHVADVLEDDITNFNWHDDDVDKFIETVELCIKSLRKAGY